MAESSTGPAKDTETAQDNAPTDARSNAPAGKTGEPAAPSGGPDGAGESGGGAGGGGRLARIRLGMRDMLISMLVLAAIVLVLAGIGRSCSFSPGGPSVDTSNLPTVDVSAELGAVAGQVSFPVRQPAVPAGWRANSASQQSLGSTGASSVVNIGWLTADSRYVQLAQSNADVADLVREAAGADQAAPVTTQGQTSVSGVTWTIYAGVRSEQAWVHDFGPVRVLITGNGSNAQFTALATAVQTAPVVHGP